MDKNFLIALLIGGASLGSAAGIATFKSSASSEADSANTESVLKQPVVAEVVSVTPLKETYFVAREKCWDEVIERPVEQPQSQVYQDENKVTGTAIGAILGGIIGNQIGGGSGKKLATIAGAVAGGYAGRKVQEGMQEPGQAQIVEPQIEQRCETYQEPKERITAYEVSYKVGEKSGSLVMTEKPGDTLPVVDGEVITETQPPQG